MASLQETEGDPVVRNGERLSARILNLTAFKQRLKQATSNRARPLPRPPSQHQAACTHLAVTRLFGHVRCQMCGHVPSLGWVYACIQDHNGDLCGQQVTSALPPSFLSSTSDDETYDLVRKMPRVETTCTAPKPVILMSQEDQASQLSSWIQKAIEEGHYTQEQVEIIKAQKQGVRDVIAIAEEDMYNSARSSGQSYDSYSSKSTTTESPSSTLSSDRERTPFQIDDGLAVSSLPHLQPVCHARVCHTCRPTFRERAYLSLDATLDHSLTPPSLELENRPISNANVVKNIYARRLRRVLKTISDTHSSTGSDIILDDESMEDDTRNLSQKASTNGLDKASGKEEETTMPPKLETNQQTTRSSIFVRKRQQPSTALGIDESQTNLAVHTPLPDIAEDSEGSEGGEVEVEDGLAVTEEGVSNSTADIILQV